MSLCYYTDGIKPVVEYSSNGSILAKYIYSDGLHIAKIAGADTHWYHCDPLGSPRKMTNESGAVVWSATYYPFGEMTAGSGNTHGFTGKEYNSETGLDYFCQRYYDPQIGRFLIRDFLQQPAYSSYTYCANNPLKYVGPLGLDKEDTAARNGLIYTDVGIYLSLCHLRPELLEREYWQRFRLWMTLKLLVPITVVQGQREMSPIDIISWFRIIEPVDLKGLGLDWSDFDDYGSAENAEDPTGNYGSGESGNEGPPRDFGNASDYRNFLPYFPPPQMFIKAIQRALHSYLVLQTEVSGAFFFTGVGIGNLRSNIHYNYTLHDVKGLGGGLQIGPFWSMNRPSTSAEVPFITIQFLNIGYTVYCEPDLLYSDPNFGLSAGLSLGSPFGVYWGKSRAKRVGDSSQGQGD